MAWTVPEFRQAAVASLDSPLLEGDLHDFGVKDAHGPVNFDLVTDRFSEESLGHRRFPRDAVFHRIDLVLADDLVDFLSAFFLLDRHRRAKNDFVAGQSFWIHDLRAFDPVAQKHKAFVDLAQAFFTVNIVAVFTAVAVARGPGHRLDEFRAFFIEELPKFLLQLVKPLGSYVIYGF